MVFNLDKLVLRLFSNTFGKQKFQNFYKKIYSFSLRGLNYGNLGFGEEYVIRLIAKSLENKKFPKAIFDVGANVGEYSELLLKYFTDSSLIYAFEPAPKTFESLLKNSKVESISKHNIGFGSSDGQLKLYKQSSNSPLASVFQREYKGVVFEDFDLVKIETVDGFCKENDIAEILFLKIDVEGYEMEVINGAKQMIETGKINYLQFEFGGTQIHSRTFFKDFWDKLSPYFTINKILIDGLEEIKKYEERLEIFSYSNFLCVLK